MYFTRLRIIGCCVVAALASGLTGCSMHPLPENISRANTFDIVERIRCEVREGLQTYLAQVRNPSHAERIIKASTIGYDFTFTITEHTNEGVQDGKLAFDRPSLQSPSKGSSLDLTAKGEKIRANTRKFRIVENLNDVYSGGRCDKAYRENWVYPITGSTGMAEVVQTYVKLEEMTDFSRNDDDQPIDKLSGKFVVFSDQLAFTTTVKAGLKTELELSAVAGKLKLTNAFFQGSAEREDIHRVTIALASDLKDEDDRPAARKETATGRAARAKLTKAKDARRTLLESDLVDDPRKVTALAQKDQPARNRVLIELQRLTDLQDEDAEAPRLLGKRLLELMRLP
ncbi:MAG: hypothetical protein ABW200_06495 [Hyphomicrobiaceae bacterium]|jgi:hypothetical protein